MAGDRWNVGLNSNAHNRFECRGDHADAPLPFLPISGMIALEVQLQCDHRAKNFLLTNFHAAMNGIAVWRRIELRGLDQIFASDEKTSALRPAHCLPARDAYQAETEFSESA